MAIVATGGLLSTSCLAAAIGGGVGVVVVGAGVVAFTCYDRVSVTVTDRLTGTPLCDAHVTFQKGGSVTEATSCYQAALSAGKYMMRVERPGLLPFEQPVDVVKSSDCGGTIQTMYIALDRPNRVVPPEQVAPSPAAPSPAAPSPAAPATPAPEAPPATPAPAVAPTPVAPSGAPGTAPSSVAPPPSATPPASAPTPAPASPSFPDAR
jgi:hypothetical protein